MQPGDIDPLEPDEVWLRSQRGTYFCPVCSFPQIERPLCPVVLSAKPKKCTLNIVGGAATDVMHIELFELLGSEFKESMETQTVSLSHGHRLADYIAIRARTQILIRGGPSSTAKGYCDLCGNLFYWPLPFESRHLLRRSIEDLLPVYGGSVVALVIREDILNRVPTSQLTGIQIYELPIRDVAEDGLPEEIGTRVTSEQRKRYEELLKRDS